MDKLPDEILLRIFKLLVSDVRQLTILSQVSTFFFRIAQDPKLWYFSFLENYPCWASRVEYGLRLIDWKDFVIHLAKQQKTTEHFTFDFVEEAQRSNKRRLSISSNDVFESSSKHKRATHNWQHPGDRRYQLRRHEKAQFWIQDPLVVDIDRTTKTGVVATGKHRKNLYGVFPRSEHKILFWEYPSWRLIRSFELNLTPPLFTCQIIGVQSIRIPAIEGTKKVRFFSLAIGIPMYPGAEPESEDKVDIWKAIFVYCLDDNGSTQCVAHVKVDNFFLGREVFLFSDTSWARSNDGDNNMNDDDDATDGDKLQDWMKVVSPANANYDPRYTVFMIAIGPIYESITGCVKLAKFDMRGQKDILDPSICRTTWDYISECLRPNYNLEDLSFQSYTPPTNMISTIKLGIEVSCMIHFKYPPNLNHLICIGSNQSDELSVYDWRFGIKVGALLWKSADQSTTHHILEDQQNNINNTPNLIEHQVNNNNNNNNNNMEDGNESDDQIEVQPWGLESTLVLPPHWSNTITSSKSLIQRGFRLIAVGDNRIGNSKNKLEIKVWDISYLLQVKWDPLKKPNIKIKDDNTQFPDLSHRFSWWKRAQKPLKKFVTQMIKEENKRNKRNRQHINNNNNNNKSHDAFCLPYSPPPGFQSMLLAHTFDKDESRVSDMPVKYTAYNVLHTSLFLLTEDGKVNVMDIETGKITRTVENIAATPIDIGPQRQIRGIDINVIGGREVVVTSKEGLLRGVVS